MMKVAVTGSRGFLGKALTKKLMEYGHEVIEIDLELGYDITRPESLSEIPDFDVLVHLAARSFVPDSFKEPASFYKTNVIGTLNALELCRKYQAMIVFTSSYVYGAPVYMPIDEKHPVSAYNPYAQSKLMGEDLCRAYERDFEITHTIFRPFNIYGPGQNASFLIPQIISQARNGNIILKDPRPLRDYVYIDDVIDAYLQVINSGLEHSEIFNLGFGQSYSVETLTKIIQNLMGLDIKITYTNEYRKNEILNTVADISKIKKLLGWEPKVLLENGINRLIKNKK